MRLLLATLTLCVSAALGAVDVAAFLARKDIPGLRAAAAAAVLSAESAGGAYLDNPGYQRALAIHEVLRTGGDAAAELAAKPEGATFLRAFLTDTAWMRAYLGTGFEPKPAGLEVLRRLHAIEPQAKPHARELMSAIAITYTASGYAENLTRMASAPRFRSTPEGRYRFYRQAQEAGFLHRMFGSLRSWELCFVVSSNCDDDSLGWMLRNINVPLGRLTDACWAVRYQGASAFGETIQGPLFYVPGRDHLNWAESVISQGGVCGSLSHFGAVAARARGVPAYTCGQPGHCAYAVRHARGEWVGGFGGPDGAPHFSPWGHNFAHIRALEAAFADDARAGRALTHLWRSRVPGPESRRAEALAAATASTTAFLPAWQERADLLAKDATLGKEAADRLVGELIGAFGQHTFPMSQVLARLEPRLIQGLDAEGRMALALRVQAAVGKGHESWSWDMPGDLLARHSKWFQGGDATRYFNQTLALHAGSKHFFGQLSAWGTKNLGKAADGTPLFTLALAEVVRMKASTLGDEALREVTKTAILAASTARSSEAFSVAANAGARFASRSEPRGDLSSPGRLVSDKAVPWLSTTSGWDQPWSHLGVINGQGGQLHTDREKEPSLTVQLPEGVLLASVVVEKTRGNEHRLRRAKIQVSTDGATWFDAAETGACPDIWKPEFGDREVRARWVRLVALNEGDGDYLHLRSFLVRAR